MHGPKDSGVQVNDVNRPIRSPVATENENAFALGRFIFHSPFKLNLKGMLQFGSETHVGH